MIKNYLAKRRIKKFLTTMPKVLAKDYGGNSEYSTGQVETAFKKLGYSEDDLHQVAIAIYCNEEAAKAFGMNESLIKKYKGYPERHRIAFDHATAGSGYDLSGIND
ncbi:DUF6559 family protein [Gilvimarinus algae]|uniref:Uncharacterized protein n=1 Tax=Gilvimarinus algae TaxID=3058037 RepID=A0ABT8TGC3_9GAMM|nr:DUF6559 family protein [Gilvimarinus sp. SDUM040014]MDO3383040.1 hypothetical protein [Gilvimarinus sp. SDUM040014]